MARTILIDGDIVAYKVASVSQEKFEWTPGETQVEGDDDYACHLAGQLVAGWEKRFSPCDVVIALSDSPRNFRKDLEPSYKAQRKEIPKPPSVKSVLAHLEADFVSFRRPHLEADDVLGILATSEVILPRGPKLIISSDKDLRQIPGNLWAPPYRFSDPPAPVQKISREQADYAHMLQTLCGDPIDNYKGCPGIGQKRAARLLQATPRADWWASILREFEARGSTEEHALLQARLARILRREDYDFVRREPILWTPR